MKQMSFGFNVWGQNPALSPPPLLLTWQPLRWLLQQGPFTFFLHFCPWPFTRRSACVSLPMVVDGLVLLSRLCTYG